MLFVLNSVHKSNYLPLCIWEKMPKAPSGIDFLCLSIATCEPQKNRLLCVVMTFFLGESPFTQSRLIKATR